MAHVKVSEKVCYHCGDDCQSEVFRSGDKSFCCLGCQTVYEILDQNGLCDYYQLNNNPGLNKSAVTINSDVSKYEFLDEPHNKQKFIEFTDGNKTNVLFSIPKIHCSSCVYLLEHLYKVHSGVLRSQVNFSKREVLITFEESKLSLRQLVELLVRLGYEPYLNSEDKEKRSISPTQKKYFYKLGIAFFCFGNIMLLSFPEYFGFDVATDGAYQKLFSVINVILSLPLVFYSSTDFFKSAITGIKYRNLNIDVPIALGIAVMFIRSVVEIVLELGPGYMDTLAGLVFLMLLGRLFQQKTYDSISFDRSYKSFFPVSVKVFGPAGKFYSRSIDEIKVGDRIRIFNEELIPADAILFSGEAHIDYSFVTGESKLMESSVGEIVYAGGKQIGGLLELEVIKDVSHSYLTELWNNAVFDAHKNSQTKSFVDIVSKYFTMIVLCIAFGAGLYWLREDWLKAIDVFTAVLIITCPCALALSLPFTMGNAIRYLNRKKIYVKSSNVLERLTNITSIVFDKTGTLTSTKLSDVAYSGKDLSHDEKKAVRSLLSSSSHPLSKAVYKHIGSTDLKPSSFKEHSGKGITGRVGSYVVRLGSQEFIGVDNSGALKGSKVFVEINGKQKGMFIITNHYRNALKETISKLSVNRRVDLVSGDNNSDQFEIQQLFPKDALILFDQSPQDKLDYINKLHKNGERVIMVGDGLNDAGALKTSDVGIALSEDNSYFTPACDIIMSAESFGSLPGLLTYAKSCKRTIQASYVLSFVYNIIGLYFAVQGLLSPLVAAILMPLSSVTIIATTTLLSGYYYRRFLSPSL